MDPTEDSNLFSTMQGLTDGVVVLDALGLVRYVNPAAARWAGVASEQWLGRALAAGDPGWLSEPSGEELRLAVKEGRALRLREVQPQGELILETLVCPGSAGSIIWVAEEVRTSAQESLEHDLMQPLGSIGNYAELIRQHGEEATRSHAQAIGRIVAALAARIRPPAC